MYWNGWMFYDQSSRIQISFRHWLGHFLSFEDTYDIFLNLMLIVWLVYALRLTVTSVISLGNWNWLSVWKRWAITNSRELHLFCNVSTTLSLKFTVLLHSFYWAIEEWLPVNWSNNYIVTCNGYPIKNNYKQHYFINQRVCVHLKQGFINFTIITISSDRMTVNCS